MHYINHYNSPLGKITFASNGKELTGLWFDGQKYFASTFILAAKIPILRRLCFYRQLRFVMKFGKYF